MWRKRLVDELHFALHFREVFGRKLPREEEIAEILKSRAVNRQRDHFREQDAIEPEIAGELAEAENEFRRLARPSLLGQESRAADREVGETLRPVKGGRRALFPAIGEPPISAGGASAEMIEGDAVRRQMRLDLRAIPFR